MTAPRHDVGRLGLGGLPDVAFAVVLAGLGDMTPARLRLLLAGDEARSVFERLLDGDPELGERLGRLGGTGSPDGAGEPLDMEASWGISGSPDALRRSRAAAQTCLRRWRTEAGATDVAGAWEVLQRAGISVARRGAPPYPRRLLRARQAPELLYVRGSLDMADRPCVGIVGTRRATHYGLEVAGELGYELASRGVVVVSGLARGIDAAAHGGVLAAAATPPVAVVGGGVDVVYPREHRRLYDEVATTGAVVSEAPPGAPPEGWRFPLRNRIIAALCQVLVVVESSRQGGAMHTVAAADACGVPVLAVPGSVRSPQSEGTNAIIAEGGAGVVLDPADVLTALSLACAEDGTLLPFVPTSGDDGEATRRPRKRGPGPSSPTPPRLGTLDPSQRAVLDAVDYSDTPTDVVCLRTKLDLAVVALVLDRLEELGAVRSAGAGWVRC